MTTSHKQLIENVASASRMKTFVICKVITNDQNPVAMLPALFAHPHNLRMFVEYPLERLRIPFETFSLSFTFRSSRIYRLTGSQQESR